MRRAVMTMAGVLGLASIASFSFADEKWYDTLTIGGYVQGSFIRNLNDPNKQQNVGRTFDSRDNSFNLNAAQIKIAKPLGDDNYGFTVKLLAGQDAGVINGSEQTSLGTVDNSPNFNVQEAYVTLAVPSHKALSFTGGKFVTAEGLEVIESPLNLNISHGLLFNYAEPLTHTGVKANYAVSPKLNLMIGLVNGWDVVQDNNKSKTIIWQIAAAPLGMITTNSFQGTYGKEDVNSSNKKRLSLDYLVGATISKLTLYFQANYGQDKGDSSLPETKKWSGLGVWANYAFTDRCSLAVRFEVFKDQDNADRLSLASGPTSYPTNGHTVKNITVTKKFQITKAVAIRAEYRHDWSNEGIFLKQNSTAVTNQNTLGADVAVQF